VPLTNFRLPTEQSEQISYVEVIADDGDVRVIARIAREAITDHSDQSVATPAQREAFVERNLRQLGEIIERKYRAGDHTVYGANPNDRLVIISSGDLLSIRLD
jgi:hypothetical protein